MLYISDIILCKTEFRSVLDTEYTVAVKQYNKKKANKSVRINYNQKELMVEYKY